MNGSGTATNDLGCRIAIERLSNSSETITNGSGTAIELTPIDDKESLLKDNKRK